MAITYKLISKNGFWTVRSSSGKYFGVSLNKLQATKLLMSLEAAE